MVIGSTQSTLQPASIGQTVEMEAPHHNFVLVTVPRSAEVDPATEARTHILNMAILYMFCNNSMPSAPFT